MKVFTTVSAFLTATLLATTATAQQTGSAVKKPGRTTTTTQQTGESTATKSDEESESKKTVKYRKSKSVDFGNQTIEGNIQRPKAALITGSESGNDSGILRLREDFMDKIAADNGEEIK